MELDPLLLYRQVLKRGGMQPSDFFSKTEPPQGGQAGGKGAAAAAAAAGDARAAVAGDKLAAAGGAADGGGGGGVSEQGIGPQEGAAIEAAVPSALSDQPAGPAPDPQGLPGSSSPGGGQQLPGATSDQPPLQQQSKRRRRQSKGTGGSGGRASKRPKTSRTTAGSAQQQEGKAQRPSKRANKPLWAGRFAWTAIFQALPNHTVGVQESCALLSMRCGAMLSVASR